jgi:hypothetical protein
MIKMLAHDSKTDDDGAYSIGKIKDFKNPKSKTSEF